jgi:hypothetical protein
MKAGEQKISGKVIRKTFAAGSKSEHEAVYLQDGDNNYKLKKAGGNPFYDESLERLVGKQVTVTGKVDGYMLIASEIKESQ